MIGIYRLIFHLADWELSGIREVVIPQRKFPINYVIEGYLYQYAVISA